MTPTEDSWRHLAVCELERTLSNYLLVDIDNILKVLNVI